MRSRGKVGPPTTSKDGERRDCRIDIRVSREEATYIRDLAAEHEMTVSELGRDCLLHEMPNTREA